MATIASLLVNLKANTLQFERGMQRASRATGTLVNRIQSASSKVAAFGSALTALAAGASFTTLIKRQFETLDSLGKMSDRLGIATGALQGFHLAAELGGVSTEQMNKALTKMLKNISDASVGLSTPKRALEEIGLSAERLTRTAPDKAFLVIADGIAKLGNEADQTRVAIDIFGRAGADLIPVMRGGADSIRGIMGEMDRMGTVSRSQAMLIEEAGDTVTRLQTAFNALAAQIAVKVAPALQAVADTLRSEITADSIKGVIVWFEAASISLAEYIEKLQTYKNFLTKGNLSPTGLGLRGQIFFGELIRDASKGLQDFSRWHENLWASLTGGRLGGTFGTIADFFSDRWAVAAAEVMRNQELLKKGNEDLTNALASRSIADRIKTVWTEAAKAMREFEAAQASANRKQLDPSGAAQKLKQLFEDIKSNVLGIGGAIAAEIDKAREKLASRAKSLLDSLQTPEERFAEIAAEIRRFAEMGLKGFAGRANELIERARKQIVGDEDIMDAHRPEPQVGAAAVERGTQEAFRALTRAMGDGDNGRNRIERLAEAELAIQRRMERHLENIKRGLDEPDGAEVEI